VQRRTGEKIASIGMIPITLRFVEPDDKKIEKSSDVAQYSIFAAGPMANFVLMIPLWLLFFLLINPVEAGITDDIDAKI